MTSPKDLKDAGLKATAPRLKIINLFETSRVRHLSAEDVRTVAAIGRSDIQPQITGKWRAGDIRHCFADISLARNVLGWTPQVSLEQGLQDLASWLTGQTAVDRGVEARAELAARGLMV